MRWIRFIFSMHLKNLLAKLHAMGNITQVRSLLQRNINCEKNTPSETNKKENIFSEMLRSLIIYTGGILVSIIAIILVIHAQHALSFGFLLRIAAFCIIFVVSAFHFMTRTMHDTVTVLVAYSCFLSIVQHAVHLVLPIEFYDRQENIFFQLQFIGSAIDTVLTSILFGILYIRNFDAVKFVQHEVRCTAICCVLVILSTSIRDDRRTFIMFIGSLAILFISLQLKCRWLHLRLTSFNFVALEQLCVQVWSKLLARLRRVSLPTLLLSSVIFHFWIVHLTLLAVGPFKCSLTIEHEQDIVFFCNILANLFLSSVFQIHEEDRPVILSDLQSKMFQNGLSEVQFTEAESTNVIHSSLHVPGTQFPCNEDNLICLQESSLSTLSKLQEHACCKQRELELRSQIENLQQCNQKLEVEATNTKAVFSHLLHELRVPIHSLSIGLTDASSYHVNSDFDDTMDTCLDSVTHLGNLLDDVLFLQKLERSELVLDKRPFNLQLFLVKRAKMLAASFDKRGIRLLFRLDPDIPCVISDSFRLSHAILNILSNAAKFARHEVVVTLDQVEDLIKDCNITSVKGFSNYPSDSKYCTITDSKRTCLFHESNECATNVITIRIGIQDDGCGMSDDQVKYIFEPFATVNAMSSTNPHGTGLGLSLSRKIVDAFGGRILVQTKQGKGSKFIIEVPIQLAPISASARNVMLMRRLNTKECFMRSKSSPSIFGSIEIPPILHRVIYKALNQSIVLPIPDDIADVSCTDDSTTLRVQEILYRLMGKLSPLSVSRRSSPNHESPLYRSSSFSESPPGPFSHHFKDAFQHSSSRYRRLSAPPMCTSLDRIASIKDALVMSASHYNEPYTNNFSSTSTESGTKTVDSQESQHSLLLKTSPISLTENLQSGLSNSSFDKNLSSTSSSPFDETHPSYETTNFAPLQALVVDDVSSNRMLLGKILKHHNFAVDYAASGIEAVDRCKGKSYDLITLDQYMDDGDGVYAASEIRRLDQQPFIVGLTGSTDNLDVVRFKSAGLDALLSKPLRVPLLLEVIRSVTNAHAGAQLRNTD